MSTASVCLARHGESLSLVLNKEQQDHAAWLHPAIREMLRTHDIQPGDLDAVAVSIGPGSYTGLRIGLATAKGFCYALDIPLITVNTLALLASAVSDEAEEWIVPLLDARRMEVFTAVYDREIREKISTHALILEPGTFTELLKSRKIIFCGNGITKLQPVLQHPNARYSTTTAHAGHLARLSQLFYDKKEFASLSYTEPLYVKDFHSHTG